nr:hypothetical protein [uncultured Prevotella sp.]
MKRKNFKHWGLFIALQLITLSLFAQGPNNTGTYYQNANGKKGKALKTAMFNISLRRMKNYRTRGFG